MKKVIKSLLCLFLCMVMLVSALPPNIVFAANPLIPEDESSYISEFFEDSEMSNLIDDFLNINTDDVIDAKLNEITDLMKNMKEASAILTGISYISYTGSAVNSILNILKTLGVMEDEENQALTSILDTVKSIKETVDEINVKVSKIQATLDTEFANTEYKLDRTTAAQRQDTWSNFISDKYETMNNMISSYQNKINQLAINWCETWKQSDGKTDLRCLYSAEGVLLYSGANYNGFEKPLPIAPGSSDDANIDGDAFDTAVAFEIVIPASYLSVNPKTTVRAENYVDVITETVTTAVRQAYKNGDFTVSPADLPLWDNAGINTDDAIVEKVAEDIVNSLFYEIASQIANSTYANGTSYANYALSAYKSFCASINGDNGVRSAIKDIYEYLSLNFAFEGEVKDYATQYYLLVGTSIVQFSAFTATLVAMAPSISISTKTNLSDLAAKTMEKNNNSYKNFITGNDNYCYPLKAVITYIDVSVQSVIKANLNLPKFEHADHFGRHVSGSDWAVVDASADFDTNDLSLYSLETKENEKLIKSSMIDARSVDYLSHYMKAAGSDISFFEYLQKNGVVSTEGQHSNKIITSDYTVEPQKFDGRQLKSLAFCYEKKYANEEPNHSTGRFVELDKKSGFAYPICDKITSTTYTIGSTPADGLKKQNGSTVATRVLTYDTYFEGYPNYLLYDNDNEKVTLSETESAVDPTYDNDPGYYTEYTVLIEKTCGAFLANYDETVDPYSYDVKISTKEELIDFLSNVSHGNAYKGKSIILLDDIDMSGVDPESYWSSADRKNCFEGHFNGNGKTIKNFTFSSSGHRVGLFRTAGNGAVIENLNFENVNISATANMEAYAALVGYATGSTLIVRNVQVLSGDISGYKYVAGIVGEAYDKTKLTVVECVNQATVTSRSNEAGGILGNTGAYYAYGCINSGTITAENGAAGGISAYVGNEFANEKTIAIKCKNTGDVTGYIGAGGICGRIESDCRISRFIGNENTGNITVTKKSSAGGIVGWTACGGAYIDNKNSGTVECKATEKIHGAGGILGGNDCYCILFINNENTNTGSVTGNDYVGGIAGYLGCKSGDFSDRIVIASENSNSGVVKSSGGHAGGIFGVVLTDNPKHDISSNSNSGYVSGKKSTGGIVGWMAGGGLFDSNSNSANILSSSANAGGIVGAVEDDKCEYKNSRIGNPYVCTGDSPSPRATSNYDYVIRSESTSSHAGKICGWDGKRNATINSDSLLASIFGNGNVIVIAALSVLLIAAAILIRRKMKKTTEEYTK